MAFLPLIFDPNTPVFIIHSPVLRDSFHHKIVYSIGNVTAFSVE